MKKVKEREYNIKGHGLGTTVNQRPVSVKLSPSIDSVVRSLPNRSEYIREAIKTQLIKDGLWSA